MIRKLDSTWICRLAWKINRFLEAIVVKWQLDAKMPTLSLFALPSNKSGDAIQSTKYQPYIVYLNVCVSFIEMPTDFSNFGGSTAQCHVWYTLYTALQHKVTLIKCAYLKCGSSNREQLNNKFMTLSDSFDRYLLAGVFFVMSSLENITIFTQSDA